MESEQQIFNFQSHNSPKNVVRLKKVARSETSTLRNSTIVLEVAM